MIVLEVCLVLKSIFFSAGKDPGIETEVHLYLLALLF